MKRFVLFGLLFFGCTRSPSLPAFEMQPIGGGEMLTDDTLARKIVLVNFWATWCGPCRAEMPALQAVYRRHADSGILVLGLLSGDQATDREVGSVASARGVTYPLVRATRELEQRYGGSPSLLPTSLLLDRAGRVIHRWNGAITEVQLEEKVREAIAN